MSMGAKHFTELMTWQLANRLKTEIYEITSRDRVIGDRGFCNQIRDSASSVCSNLGEGFARYSHRDFARFVVIARGSMMETQNHLLDAVDRGHIEEDEFKRLWEVSRSAVAAVTGLLKYLQKTDKREARQNT